MSNLDKVLEWQRINSRYYLRLGDNPELEVTEAEFIAAERAAGFFPKAGCGPLATAGFGSNHVLGRIESPAFKDYPRLADLERVVIDGAIRFRRAETAAWVTSEVGTVEEAAAAKAERPRAYIAMVNAVDALLREREGGQ